MKTTQNSFAYTGKRFVPLCISIWAFVSASAALANDDFDFKVMAQTGQNGIAGFKSSPVAGISVNDRGDVAFVGLLATGGEGIFVASDQGVTNVTPNFSSYTFSSYLQMNNKGVIVTRTSRGAPSIFSISAWTNSVPDSRNVIHRTSAAPVCYCSGGSHAGEICTTDFTCYEQLPDGRFVYWDCRCPSNNYVALLFPSINNSGQIAYLGSPPGTTQTNALERYSPDKTTRTLLTRPEHTPRPMIADDGRIVGRMGDASTAPIILFESGFSSQTIIADSSHFSQLGQHPGISDNGSIVVFFGNLTDPNATQPQSSVGPGIFAYLTSSRSLIRVAQVKTTNPADTNTVASFSPDTRVGINNRGYILFQGINQSGQKALFRTTTNLLTGSFGVPNVIEVIAAGATIPNLAGVVSDLAIWDSINNSPLRQVACSVAMSDGTQAIVRIQDKLPFRVLDAAYQFTALTNYPIVNSDSNQLSLLRASELRVGATADGASILLLRFDVAAPGRVTFTELSGLPGDILSRVDSAAPPVSVSTIDTSQFSEFPAPAKHVAFALYHVPETIGVNESMHTVTIKAEYTPDDSMLQPQTEQTTIDLARPPVLLVHGTWSSPQTWSDNTSGARQRLLDALFTVRLVDWKSLNAKNYAAKRDIFWKDLNHLREEYHGNLFAFTRADVVSHSQGGNIVRLFAQDSRFRGPENFQRGYFRRFIPLACPHLGTEFANTAHEVLATSPLLVSAALKAIFKKAGMTLDDGAVEDLEVGSCANRGILDTPIPTHNIVDECGLPLCAAGEIAVAFLFDFLKFSNVADLRYLINGGTFQSTVFGGRINDTIVGVDSQLGGLPIGGINVSYFTPLKHTDMTSDTSIGDEVLALLRGSTNRFVEKLEAIQTLYDRTGYANGYQTCPPSRALIAASLAGVQPAAPSPTITITSPAEGTILTPGASLTVSVEPANGIPVDAVLILVGAGEGSLASAVLEGQPFTTNFILSARYVGDLPITVYARGTNGEISPQPETRILRVNTMAQVQAIRVAPDTLSFTSQGSGAQLDVYAQFSDGIERKINAGIAGLQFQTSNPLVAGVSTNGFVTAVADGVTVISVSAGGVTKTVDVRVRLGIPYVLSITPNALMSLATPVQFQLTGWNLGGISWVNFVFQGTNDGNFVVTNLQVNVDGTIATGTLIVATNAVFGPRTIIVTTSGGLSSSIPMTGNIFATKPSIGLGNLSVTIQNATNTYTKLDVLSPAELSVVLQVSPDLVTWVSVRTNIGSFQYLETNSAPHSTRFFRALTSP